MTSATTSRLTRAVPVSARLWQLASFVLLLIGSLALTRLAYEWRFPEWLWLGRPLPVLLLATGLGLAIALAGRRIWRTPGGALALLPLALNLIYLIRPEVALAFSRVLWGGSLWLVAVLLAWWAVPDARDARWRWLGPLLVVAALAPLYLLTMSSAVGEADTFEFQVVAPQLGIAHPTGYPLYLLLGKLFSLVPIGTIAWRINFASAVYAVLAAVIIFGLSYRLLRRPLPAVAGAVAWGTVPVVWSQGIVAEVYTLHALIVAVALWLMVGLLAPDASDPRRQRRLGLLMAFVIGLGLTNHLTTVFLIPPALLAGLFAFLDRQRSGGAQTRIDWRYVLLLGAAFFLPLLLYLYLPWRWQVVNGEPMGLARFVDWVAGGRFQGALQWMAWLRDPARFGIVGRLVLDSWGWFYLVWAAVGVVYMWVIQRRALLLLLVTAAGFTFYALNYYVPDLAVFLLPLHVVIAVWIAAGAAGAIDLVSRAAPAQRSFTPLVVGAVFLLVAGPLVLRAADRYPALDQSNRDGGETWARGVLARPLPEGAAILADSEKIAPLYYLQQNEGLRPDLDIMVLPDEAVYRAELDRRVAAGQPVYLARFLPGLAGVYHLRSAGPLVQVDSRSQTGLPDGAEPAEATFGPARLVGVSAEPVAAEDPQAAAVTLYWTPDRPLSAGEELPVLYLRWASNRHDLPQPAVTGAHVVDNTYPLNAWRPDEIIADYHALPVPVFDCPPSLAPCELDVQAAWGPRFAAEDDLEWMTVARLPVEPPLGPVAGQDLRAQLGTFLLDGVDFSTQIRPETPLTINYSGIGDGSLASFSLRPTEQDIAAEDPLLRLVPLLREGPSRQYVTELPTDVPPGRYALQVEAADKAAALCGWLAPVSATCTVGVVEISGAPLPEGATNFADRLALVDIDIPQTELSLGGQLALELTWQALAPMNENYTVFVQVLDAQDRIVGQVDAWPVQGTFPTSQWTPGELVRDPYVVQLGTDLPPGDYKLNIGLYLLGTLERLPVLDAAGQPVDDKVEVGGLAVAPR